VRLVDDVNNNQSSKKKTEITHTQESLTQPMKREENIKKIINFE
jgi:hypothetical protein